MNQRTHHITGALIFHFEQITGVEDIAPPGRVAALERLVSQVFRVLDVKASGRAAIRAWLEWREMAKIEAAAAKKRSGLFDSHPSDAERLRFARAATSAGMLFA